MTYNIIFKCDNYYDAKNTAETNTPDQIHSLLHS